VDDGEALLVAHQHAVAPRDTEGLAIRQTQAPVQHKSATADFTAALDRIGKVADGARLRPERGHGNRCPTLDDRDDAGDLGSHGSFRRSLLRPVQLDDGPAPLLEIAAQVTAAPTRRGPPRSAALALSAIWGDLRG